ncbi:hypothetical protein D7Z54_32910 [Salibacterium salarium]|uniref:Uncharacterized protein n=1 Tax=Salibacterium salarium TaxID=284579 RepID=A0A3R9P1V4_9BACI|nr:hypothetical protein [Salibacterium salarium]RSL29133.1 hypothetical protein D7Z54_32910 [Salibacterium salarium]
MMPRKLTPGQLRSFAQTLEDMAAAGGVAEYYAADADRLVTIYEDSVNFAAVLRDIERSDSRNVTD